MVAQRVGRRDRRSARMTISTNSFALPCCSRRRTAKLRLKSAERHEQSAKKRDACFVKSERRHDQLMQLLLSTLVGQQKARDSI